MSRPLRIDYPNAWYHIMNRGRRGEQVFTNTWDYTQFIDLLQDTSEIWNLRLVAYCLMPNHYHLLVQTPDANISRCMRHIDGVYTQRFNRFHDCDGPLFRGRYKSILIEADNYLLHLVRYIHRNPLKAGFTDRLDKYIWSSHKGYLSNAEKWNWLHKNFVLMMFSPHKGESLERYRQFMAKDEESVSKILEKKKWPSILGSERFINLVKERFFLQKTDEEVPQAKELAPDIKQIKKKVVEYYGITEDELLQSRRGVFNEPRNVAIYVGRQLRGDSLKQIGEQYQIHKYSSVSSVIERMKALMATDRKLSKRVEKITTTLRKSQEQT
ncbi:MAG: transposase [Desulfobacterales bacterium]|nr:MAG: transposase [Desulfobacterales bacterium]